MPAFTGSEAANTAIFTTVRFAEFVYQYAKKGAALLSRPVLWPTLLLIIPKINLIPFRNETAGVRLDDFALLIVATLLLCGWVTELRFRVEAIPATGFAVAAVFCTSNFINAGHSNILYSLRLLEYLVFFWSGKAFVRDHHDFTSLAKFLIGINGAFIVLQYAGIVGGFTADGYEAVLDRPFGLTANHPAEMGAFLNVVFAALVFGTRTGVRFWYWSTLTGLCIFMTGSRSALFAHCLLTLVYLYRHSKNKTALTFRTLAISGLLIAVFASIPNSVSNRSGDLLSQQNFETFRDLYEAIPVDQHFTGFAEGGAAEEAPEGVDPSWYMRGFKWAQVVKTMFAQPGTVWIFGLGPGSLTPALDGGWLRLIIETGVVGTFAFIWLLRKISRLSTSCLMAVLALAVNMMMVDSHIAYKVMAFLFFLAGTQIQRMAKRADEAGSFAGPKLREA
jgi:hypothetical protein